MPARYAGGDRTILEDLTMIGSRIVTTLAAAAVALGTLGAATTAASAAGVSITFGVNGAYNYPPPGDRSCWRWSHPQHQWVWTCHRDHPSLSFDMHSHKWH
jgi:hypothetical protein